MRAAARVAAALAAAAMFAALWTAPAAAGASGRQSLAAGASRHPKVKYYIVPKSGHGPPVALYGIAVRTLGDSHRYIEIFNLNKGRLQPNGGRLENPHTIDPGWVLQLPADASGPGVHFGRLPGRRPAVTASPSPRPSPSAAGGTATSRPQPTSSGTSSMLLAGAALLALVAAGLAFWISRRRSGAARQRKHSLAKSPAPQDGSRTSPAVTTLDIRGTDPAPPGADQPGWPGAGQRSSGAGPGRPGMAQPGFPGAAPRPPAAGYPGRPADPRSPETDPYWPGAEHPSFPGADPRLTHGEHPSFPGAGYPGWPAAGPRQPAAEHPGWPGGDHPSFPRAPAGPRREPSPGPHYDHSPQSASRVVGLQDPDGGWGPPDAPPAAPPAPPAPPDPGQRWSGQVARTADPAAQAHQQVALGDPRFQVMLPDAPGHGWHGADGLGARPQDLMRLGRGDTAQLAETVRQQAGEVRNVHSLWLAGRILSGAENQAAEIRQEAYEQAAALRAAAEREAAQARQQAAATRATAEAEAAELLTAAKTMQSELGRVAAYVTESLTSPGLPVTKPGPRPGTKPGARPAARPAASPAAEPAADPAARPGRPARKPAARPAAKPATRPGAEPAASPDGRPSARPGARPAAKPGGRQVNAMRKMVIALVAVFLVGGLAGATEIGLHGFSFFMFRNAGAGAGNSRDLNENQGPGQPDAPGAHPKAHPGQPPSKPPASRQSGKPGKSN